MTLHSVPTVPLRAIAYIRVSTARDDMISPELQRTAIEDYCARRGYRLIGEPIEDLDMSGRFWKRRKVETAIAMIEAHEADVIVVWKGSRLARNRLDWAVAVDRIESVGGRLESATEPVDASTSTGRFTRGMLAELAAFESDRMGDGWREVHARRTKAGKPANGKPRFGYRVVDGLHRPDPVEAAALAACYRRYVAGETILSLARWLNSQGIRTIPGYSTTGPGVWSQTTLRRTLDSGFGAGLILVHGSREQGIHEPVIDEATWTTYLAARAGRRTLRRSESSKYLLSGLMRCGHVYDDGAVCGSGMGGGAFGHNGTKPGYRCSRAASSGMHHAKVWWMGPLNAAVYAWLVESAAEVNNLTDQHQAQQAKRTRRKVDADALGREVLALDKSLARLAVNEATEAGVMPRSVYEAARDELLTQRRNAEDRLLAARAEASAGPAARLSADLVAEWDELTVEMRRGILRRLVRRIIVGPDGVEIVPIGD